MLYDWAIDGPPTFFLVSKFGGGGDGSGVVWTNGSGQDLFLVLLRDHCWQWLGDYYVMLRTEQGPSERKGSVLILLQLL